MTADTSSNLGVGAILGSCNPIAHLRNHITWFI